MPIQIIRKIKNIGSFINDWKKNGVNHAFSQMNTNPTNILPIILLPKLTNWRNFFRFQKVGLLTACDIAQPLDKSTELGHTTGIVINKDAEIGKEVHIRQNVTIAGKSGEGAPTIEDKVEIGAGAVILGGITLGENSIIGANATVTTDIPPNSIAVGTPAEVIKEVNSER